MISVLLHNNTTKENPIVFTGDYNYENVQCLLSDYVPLLKPNVIWVEYRVAAAAGIQEEGRIKEKKESWLKGGT